MHTSRSEVWLHLYSQNQHCLSSRQHHNMHLISMASTVWIKCLHTFASVLFYFCFGITLLHNRHINICNRLYKIHVINSCHVCHLTWLRAITVISAIICLQVSYFSVDFHNILCQVHYLYTADRYISVSSVIICVVQQDIPD